MNISEFKKLPLLGILRGIKDEHIEPLVETMVSSGLKAVEITMNTENASVLIEKMVDSARGRLMVGAGTVLNKKYMNLALDAGATFIVSPTLVKDVTEYCSLNNIPVFPGAFTPQEIFNAWECGATMVKVFPAKFFGPDYIKEIKGPLNKIELLACGGVNKNTLPDFFKAGSSAIAFGGSLFDFDLMNRGLFSEIQKKLEDLIFSYKNL